MQGGPFPISAKLGDVVWSSAFRRCFLGGYRTRPPPKGGTPNPEALRLTDVQLSEKRPVQGLDLKFQMRKERLASLVFFPQEILRSQVSSLRRPGLHGLAASTGVPRPARRKA